METDMISNGKILCQHKKLGKRISLCVTYKHTICTSVLSWYSSMASWHLFKKVMDTVTFDLTYTQDSNNPRYVIGRCMSHDFTVLV